MTEAGCCRLWALCYRNAGEQKAVRLPLWGRVFAVLESHGQQLHFKNTFLGQKIEVMTFFRLNSGFFQKSWLMMIGYLMVKHPFIQKSPKIHFLVHSQTIFQRTNLHFVRGTCLPVLPGTALHGRDGDVSETCWVGSLGRQRWGRARADAFLFIPVLLLFYNG